MAMYYCGECGELVDDDYNPGTDIDGELVCESCVSELDEDNSEK